MKAERSQSSRSFEYDEEDEETVQSRKAAQIIKYPTGNPVLFMNYPRECKEKKSEPPLVDKVFWEKYSPYKILYKCYANVPACIILAFERNSCIRTKSYTEASIVWKLMNADKMRPFIKKIRPNQRFNHFPCTWELGRKDKLTENIKRMSRSFPKEFTFLPLTFVFPKEATEGTKVIQQSKGKWIVKPVASSRGRGIHLLTDKEKLPAKGLISKYIADPHIINNKKYDLRLYVLISSFTPLKVYLYKEGLVRFATEDYSTGKESIDNKFIHLTNYSINKKSEKYNENTNFGEDGEGSKWNLSAYRQHLEKEGVDVEKLFEKINDLVVKTILSIAPETVDKICELTDTRDTMFEIYGFDVLIDERMKPWLMEVNLNPSLSCGSELDLKVKTMMITDTLAITGLVPHSLKNSTKTICPNDNVASQLTCLKREIKRGGLYDLLFPRKENFSNYIKFVGDLGKENAELWKELESE